MVQLNTFFIIVLFFIEVHGQYSFIDLETKAFNKKVQDYINKNNYTFNTCTKDILGLFAALRSEETWAVKMIDSGSKIQSGFLEGNIVNYGSYDQCLSVEGKVNDRIIKGKHCMFLLYLTKHTLPKDIPTVSELLNLPIRNNSDLPLLESVCIPDSCTSENLNQVFSNSNILPIDGIFVEDLCNTNDNKTEFTPLHWFFLLLITLNISLLLICTIYDLYLQNIKQKPYHPLMISFSVYTNIKQLIKVKKDPDQLSCVHGIRSLSMAWVVLGHKFLLECMFPHDNYLYSLEWLKENTSVFVVGAFYAVDTFLLISGMLITLSPPLIMMILFYMTFLSSVTIGAGPLSKIIYKMMSNSCKTNWWASMLFLQNTLKYGDICLTHTWYLATDTQLYIIAPLLFIPIQKWPKRMLVVITVLIIISILSTFIITWNMKLSASVLSITKAYREIYTSPLVRGSVWLIGCLLGYILFKTRTNKVAISKVYVFIIWSAVISMMYWLIYLQIYFNKTPYEEITASLFLMFARPLWGLCVSWIIFSCSNGYNRVMNAFLSNRIFIIIGRLSYCMYIVHLLVLHNTTIRKKNITTFSNFNVVSSYWSDLIYTLILSFIWALCFESPVIAIGKALMPQEMSEKLKKINEDNETTFNEISNNRQYITRL